MRPQPRHQAEREPPWCPQASPGPVPSPRISPPLRGARALAFTDLCSNGPPQAGSTPTSTSPWPRPLCRLSPWGPGLGSRPLLHISRTCAQGSQESGTNFTLFRVPRAHLSGGPCCYPAGFAPLQLQGPAQQGHSGQDRQMDAGKPEALLPAFWASLTLRAWERGPKGLWLLAEPRGPDSTQEKARAAPSTPGLQCPKVSPSPSKGLCDSGKGKQRREKGMGARRQKKPAPPSHKGRRERARTSEQAAVPQ